MKDTETALNEWPAWPVHGLIDDLLPVLEQWAGNGDRIVLATLVDIVGSSPRPLGSEMAIRENGQVAGYVSGGCVEGAVAAEAQGVLADGAPRLLDYGAGSPVLDVQLTCGGRIGIFVREVSDPSAYVGHLKAARSNRRAAIVDIDLATGAHHLSSAATAPPTFAHCFRQTYLPPCRLIVVGGDPVTLALCRLAGLFGFEVGLIRPYGPGAPPPDTPLVHYDTRPLPRALADLTLDPWAALYTLTHDLDDDQAVIEHGLNSDAFRVGALGSQAKAAQRLDHLRSAGLAESQLKRLDTPAGLDIGARNPREIALSILAALTAARPLKPMPQRLPDSGHG